MSSTTEGSTGFTPGITVALMGEICSGKSHIAQALEDYRGFVRLPLALPLKREVAANHGISVEELNARKADFRTELQEVGHTRRQQDPAYWIKRWVEARAALRRDVRVVVEDCRHANEAQLFLDMARTNPAVLARVMVPAELREERIRKLYGRLSQEQRNASSEVEIPFNPFHFVISGDSGAPEAYLQHLLHGWERSGRPVLCVKQARIQSYVDDIPEIQPTLELADRVELPPSPGA